MKFLFLFLALFPSLSFAKSGDLIPNQYIVVLKEEAALPRSAGVRILQVYSHALNGASVEMSEDDAAELAKNPSVLLVEQDREISINLAQQKATPGIDRIDSRNGRDTVYNYSFTGKGVHAYVIDTGIRATHSEFKGRIGAGYTAIEDGQGTNDCAGHGSHVAGTIGGSVLGVAKSVTLHPVRVLGCNGSGSNAGVIAGVDWVTRNAIKPAVANMSLGGGMSTALDNAVKKSIRSGVTYALAAGNENTDACSSSPARVGEGITVGAVNKVNDGRANFSNYGSCLDIFAPGVDIVSVNAKSDTTAVVMSGTSMAAPHVAGAAALILEQFPAYSPDQVRDLMVMRSTRSAVTDSKGSANRLLYTAP